MARGKSSLRAEDAQKKDTARRTVFFLSPVLIKNLEAYSASRGVAKGEVVRTVLTKFLKAKGLQPDKRPKVVVQYE
jgi:hypothetical protein